MLSRKTPGSVLANCVMARARACCTNRRQEGAVESVFLLSATVVHSAAHHDASRYNGKRDAVPSSKR